MMEPIVRGCGRRIAGGVYVECPLGPNGMPLEYFIVDAPIVIDPARFGIGPRGVGTWEKDGVTHIVDWVGSEHYPNVLDFIEETRRHGLSRRLPSAFPFAKLTPASMVILLHSRAHIVNVQAFRGAITEQDAEGTRRVAHCPKPEPIYSAHAPMTIVDGQGPLAVVNPQMCAGLWWDDLDRDKRTTLALDPAYPARTVDREMPGFTYQARVRPEVTVEYQPAVFLKLPAANLAVIEDKDGGTHEATIEKARNAGINVTLEPF